MKIMRVSCCKNLTLILLGFSLFFPACEVGEPKPQRYAMVIGLKPEKIAEYKKLHAEAWPEIQDLIKMSNIRNYSINLGEVEEGKYLLFAYFEYYGSDFEKDMEAMAAPDIMKQWWELTDACQIPCPTRKEGEFWMKLEAVFYCN